MLIEEDGSFTPSFFYFSQNFRSEKICELVTKTLSPNHRSVELFYQKSFGRRYAANGVRLGKSAVLPRARYCNSYLPLGGTKLRFQSRRAQTVDGDGENGYNEKEQKERI